MSRELWLQGNSSSSMRKRFIITVIIAALYLPSSSREKRNIIEEANKQSNSREGGIASLLSDSFRWDYGKKKTKQPRNSCFYLGFILLRQSESALNWKRLTDLTVKADENKNRRSPRCGATCYTDTENGRLRSFLSLKRVCKWIARFSPSC